MSITPDDLSIELNECHCSLIARCRLCESAPDLRWPADRPGWVGEFQPWPCGRCGQEVDDSEPHPCRDPVASAATEEETR